MFAFPSVQRRVSRTLLMTTLVCAVWGVAIACSSSSEQGVEATFMLSSVGDPPMQDGVRRFDTDRGYLVELSRGYVVLEHLELQRCVEEPALGLLWRPALAFAHTGGNPRRLAAPVFIDLTAPAAETALGAIHPPAATYCAFQHSLGPADADTTSAPPDAVGRSLLLEFSVSGGGLPAPRTLSLQSDAVFDGFYAIDPMALDATHRQATVQITHTGESWFDGIDFETADDERVLQKFLRNFRDSVEVSWQ